MAVNFPSNPTNGDTVTVGGINYVYDSTQGVWSDSPQGLAQSIDNLTDVDTSTTAPANRQVLQWNSTNQEWGPADSGVQVYATIDDLPLSGVTEGSMALVDSTDKLYIFSDTGWYSIAIVNQTPSISGVNATYTLATDGTATTVTVTATDPEGLPITYSIVSDTSGNIATVAQGTGANTNQWTITPSTSSANAGNFTLVFRASDGVNIASASSTFELKFQTVNSNYTTALITPTDNGYASNKVFYDSSGNNHTITANGDATQNTFSPYRSGGYSTYFDGTGDRLTFSHASDFSFGTGDFTIEFWIKAPTNAIINGYSRTICEIGQFKIYMRITQYHGGTDGALLIHDGSTGVDIGGTVSLSDDVWHHVAVVRESGTAKCWVDGAYMSGVSHTTSLTETGTNAIGAQADGNGSLQGIVADLRVVKGTAVYTGTSDFTPPTERLTAITNTSLLTCHLPYIADGSTNDHSITVTGNTTTIPFSPYDYQEYSASSHGGSAYFDGTGDYLTIADSADLDMGSSDFTIEGWYYPSTAASSANGLLSKRANSSESNGVLVYFAGNGSPPSLLVAQSGSWAINTQSSIYFKTGIWNHFAVVRNGTSFKLYINGKAGVSVTSSVTIPDNNSAFAIGAMGADGSSVIAACNIADFRIVKGTAVYTSDFTPPTAPLTAITNTSLLLPFDDATIIDKSQASKAVKLLGNTTISSTQTKHLNYSMYFDGTGDYIDIPLDAASGCDFGTGDFTIEGWFHIASLSTYYIADTRNPPPEDAWAIFISSNRLYFYDGATSRQTTNAPATGQWVHFAITRESGSWRMFLDGSLEAGPTSVTRSINGGTRLRIAASGAATPGSPLNGYLSDFRITKGLARYTSNFTAPTTALEG